MVMQYQLFAQFASLFFALVLFTGETVAEQNTPNPDHPEMHRYNGPLFDAMAQIDQKSSLVAAMRSVEASGVNKIALFARSRKALHQDEKALLSLQKKFPDLIVLGVPKYFLLRDDLSKEYIEACLQGIQDHKYSFVGEILYTHANKSGTKKLTKADRYVDPLAPNTDRLLTLLDDDIPVMTHWESWAWDRDWPRFSKLYASHPKQKFIIPHIAFASIEQAETILSSHPNVYVTLSKKLDNRKGFGDKEKQARIGRKMLNSNWRLKQGWREIVVKYSDRILFATDAHKSHTWPKYEHTVDRYRVFAAQLPSEVAKNVSYRNAELLYGVTVNKPH